MTKEMLEHFAGLSPSDSAVYHVGADGSLKTLYLSENVPALLDLTREEYLAITARDAMDLTLPADRAGLQRATVNCVKSGRPFDYYYRVFHKVKGFEWVHVHAHVCGSLDGRPLILALFANMTAEGGIYQQLLDTSDRKVFVIDRSSFDLLYANEKATTDGAGRVASLLDQKCYGFLHGFSAPCERCPLKDRRCEELCDETDYDAISGKWEQFTRRLITWCGHPALLIYIKDVTAEKNSELTLERYRRMYADATQEAKLIVWTYDAEKHSVAMLWDGYTRDICEALRVPQIIENVPASLAAYVDPRDREGFVNMYREIDGGAQHSSCEFRFQLPNQDQPRYERAVANAIFDENGRRVGVYCIGQNVTRQKQAQDEYNRMREQLVGNLADVVGSFQLNLSKNLYISGYSCYPGVAKALERPTADGHFAATADTVVNADIKREIIKEYTCAHLTELFRNGQNELARDYPVRTSRGSVMWVHSALHMMLNPSTGDIEGITYSKDITRQKRNEEIIRLAVSENCEYVGIVDTAAGIYERHSGTWLSEAKEGQRFPYDEIRADMASMFLTPEGVTALLRQTDIPVVVEALKHTPRFIISYHCRPGEDGSVPMKQISFSWLNAEHREVLVTQQDVTAAYEQEQQRLAQMRAALIAADRANEAKSAFLSTMSHDLRTPLNGVLGFTDFALKESDPVRKQEYLEKVRHSGALLLNLINDTLELSRIESGKMTVTPEAVSIKDVGLAVIDSLRPAAEAKGVKLVSGAFPDKFIYVDKLKFQKIWLNLLSNAIKYTPRGGTVHAFVEPIDPPKGDRNRRIVVEDTGIGMSEEFMSRMFEPFAQENRPEAGSAGGTGLGLAIVKRIVDLLGGTISVRSRLGEGTRFEVEVPIPPVSDIAAAEQEPSPADGTLAGKRILLCEDNLLNCEIAETLLKNKGMDVESAENGQAGLSAFAASSPGRFDAILMDIRMPVMDGYEAARSIRALARPDAKTVPIIAMTADAFEESTREAASSGMNGYLTKPVVPEKLYETLSGFLSRKSEGGTPGSL